MTPLDAPDNRPGRTRVLVIDDDPVVLEVVKERLESAGYSVATRDEVLGTTRWITANRPDLLLLDVMMPALDGSGLASLLRSHRETRGIAVILHSSMPSAQLANVAATTGALGYICKTSDADAFLREFASIAARAGSSVASHK